MIKFMRNVGVTPASRETLIERMKAELPQSTGELLEFFNAKNIQPLELSKAYHFFCNK